MLKEELKQEITKLKEAVEQHQEQVKDLQHDLNVANIKLEDVDKPKLTSKQLEDLSLGFHAPLWTLLIYQFLGSILLYSYHYFFIYLYYLGVIVFNL